MLINVPERCILGVPMPTAAIHNRDINHLRSQVQYKILMKIADKAPRKLCGPKLLNRSVDLNQWPCLMYFRYTHTNSGNIHYRYYYLRSQRQYKVLIKLCPPRYFDKF